MLISGADGQDDVIGSPGNDILDGLAGDDRYLGGDGSDVFVLGAGDLDQVFDVMAGADLIDVSAWGTESLDGLTITGGAGTVLLVDETTGDMAVVRDPAGTLVPEDLTEASFVFAPADMSLAGVDESLLSTGIA